MSDIEFIKSKDYRYYLYAIAFVLILWFLEPSITKVCFNISKFLGECNRTPFAIGVILFTIMLCVVVGKSFFTTQKTYVAHKHLAVLIPLIAVYAFYRLIDDNFYFWGFDIGNCHFAWMDLLVIPLILRIVQKFCYTKRNGVEEKTTYVLSDNPINKKEDDVFGYYNLALELLNDLKTVDTSEKAFSVGVVGAWGHGKSSFLNLFCEHVENSDEISLTFNPRSSKDVKNIQEDFLKSLCKVLAPYHSDVDHKLLKYAQALELVDEKWIGKAVRLFQKLDSTEEKESINNAIRQIGKRIFVIIDDFDRLNAEEILEVLKLIDRNADFNNIIYLTAYDKNYICLVLSKHLTGETTQNYTDKYFNLEYPLPHQDKKILMNRMFQYLNAKLVAKENQEDFWNIRNVLQQDYRFISKHITSLRHVNRFVNLFLSRYSKVKDDVDFNDFLILSLIRYLDIKTYYAIANRLMIFNPSAFGENEVYELIADYPKQLEGIAAKDGIKELVEVLFPQIGSSVGNNYGRIRNVNSFDLYFYDFQIGHLYYKDLIQLFDIDSEEESFKLIDQFAEKNNLGDVSEFLRSRSATWIGNQGRLSRLFKLLAYVNEKVRSQKLETELGWLINIDSSEEYERTGISNVEYKIIISESLSYMMSYTPVGIGFLCQQKIDSLLSENSSFSKDVIFTQQELTDFALKAQKSYLNTYGTSNFNLGTALNLSYIKDKNVISTVVRPAKEQLIAFLKEQAEKIANKLVVFELKQKENPKEYTLNIGLHMYFYPNMIFPLDDYGFNDWINSISDAKKRFVISKLHSSLLNGDRFMHIQPLQETYKEGDFEAFAEAIEKNEEKLLDESVSNIVKEGDVFELGYLVGRTGVEIDKIKVSIQRLVAQGLIDDFYLNLNEKMPQIEINDFVKIKQNALEEYSAVNPIKRNLFTIHNIRGDYYDLLEMPDVSFPKNSIAPVRINGKDDAPIYFDPVIAAPTVSRGEPIPSYSVDKTYFMRHFENCFDENHVSYKELVKQHNFLYVHEVQHWLREESGQEELKLMKS